MPKITVKCPKCGIHAFVRDYHASPVYMRERAGGKNAIWTRLNGVFRCDRCGCIFIFPEDFGAVETMTVGGNEIVVINPMTPEERENRSNAKLKYLNEQVARAYKEVCVSHDT